MDDGGGGERQEGRVPAVADRVTAAAAELYGAEPEEFTDRRKALAEAARTAGDKNAAKAIAGLRKPTQAAWVVNRLARDDPGASSRLAATAAALRAAEQAKDGPRLRELSAARGALIDALTGQALAAAGLPDPAPSLRAEVSDTLTAALADPGVAAAFAAGTLDRAAHWSGFGPADFSADFGTGGDIPDPDADALPAERAGGRVAAGSAAPGRGADAPAADPAPTPLAPRRARRSAASSTAPARTEVTPARMRPPAQAAAAQAAARVAAEQERLARQAAERAARQKSEYEDAERTVASAATAAAGALAAEDRLEAEVRDLEQRLTRARADLRAARLNARRSEAAERRARQSLERLPRP